MNERQARQAGYTFTGIYERNHKRDIVKARAAELRKKGNKAIMVNTECGVSVYWIESNANALQRKFKNCQSKERLLMNEIWEKEKELRQLKDELLNTQKEQETLQKEIAEGVK